MLGILTGIGLMTINNIGNDVSIVPILHLGPIDDGGNYRLKRSGTPMMAKSTNHSSRKDSWCMSQSFRACPLLAV
jgi:hypothetical protein